MKNTSPCEYTSGIYQRAAYSAIHVNVLNLRCSCGSSVLQKQADFTLYAHLRREQSGARTLIQQILLLATYSCTCQKDVHKFVALSQMALAGSFGRCY